MNFGRITQFVLLGVISLWAGMACISRSSQPAIQDDATQLTIPNPAFILFYTDN